MSLSRGLIVAAPASGCGKTTVTLGILRALARDGLNVSSFKVGPDYIDPSFHSAATGRTSMNLDSWAMRSITLGDTYRKIADHSDFVIGEGVMGLFDGATGGKGSTAETAAALGLPVLLVVDASAQAQSAAASIHGFMTWDDRISVKGVIFNRVGSERHAHLLREAAAPLHVPVLGYLPKSRDLKLPHRHLGLVQASELRELDTILERAADLVSDNLDLTSLLSLASGPAETRCDCGEAPIRPPGQRIAVASDDAFRFTYGHIMAGWRSSGATILPFSPLDDQPPDGSCDAVYLPGGYPELHADKLARNRTFLDGLRNCAERSVFIYGECGGYMVLGQSLTDSEGAVHCMAGLLPVTTSFANPRLHLGYREAALHCRCPLGPPGSRFRGHEFHYAAILHEDASGGLFAVRDASGESLGSAGLRRNTVMGSFIHLIDRA